MPKSKVVLEHEMHKLNKKKMASGIDNAARLSDLP
jgi:hypothetical protein